MSYPNPFFPGLGVKSARAGLTVLLLFAARSTVEAATYSGLVSKLGAIAYWRLGESLGTTAVDSAGRHHGTYTGGVALGQVSAINGDPDSSAGFDGVNDYVDIAHNGDLLLDNGTVIAWIRADTIAGSQAFFSKDGPSSGSGGNLTMYVDSGGVRIDLQDTTTTHSLQSIAIPANLWFQVALTFGSGGMKLYLNAALVDSNAYTGGLGTTSGGSGNVEPVTIAGSRRTAGKSSVSEYFDGTIDEAAIFPTELSSSQILDLYNAALPQFSSLVDGYVANVPLAWWRLGESPGATVAADVTGNHNGTYVGPTLGAASVIPADTAADFDGVNDHVDIPSIDVPTSQMTILLWFRADDFGVPDARFISKTSSSGTPSFYWRVGTISSGADMRLRYGLKTDIATTSLTASSGNLQPNVWTFVAAVYDGNQLLLFKDGQFVGSTPASGSISISASVPAAIGDAPPGDGSAAFDGTLDEIAIFDHALTTGQIRGIFNAATTSPASGVQVLKWVESP